METKLIKIFHQPPPHERQQQPVQVDEDIDMMDVDVPEPPQQPPTLTSLDQSAATENLNFTDLIQDLCTVYPDQQMKDISTSYCFICLLHLANEKGLVLETDGEGESAMQEIHVSRDPAVGEGYEGE